MRKSILKSILLLIAVITPALAQADDPRGVRKISDLEIDLWVNKGDQSTYYYGEDIAVYFRASEDCYVVVYDIDPSGNVTLLFPDDYDSDNFVRGGEVYRIPDQFDDYRLEVNGPSGREYMYAVATRRPMPPPDFIRYAFFDYGDWDYYYDDFVHTATGQREAFVNDLNYRIAGSNHVSARTMIYIDENYRHHRWYRHWRYEPYTIGSVWIDCDFPGAEIWIDGVYFGMSPCWVPEIYIGRHWIWVYYNGYPCWQDYVWVRHGHRQYVNVKVDRRYRDYRYARDNFRDWRFKEKKYRNDPDFIREAKQVRGEHVRQLRTPPSKIVEKYNSRKVVETYRTRETDRRRLTTSDEKRAVREGNSALKKVERQKQLENQRVERERIQQERQEEWARNQAQRQSEWTREQAERESEQSVKKEEKSGFDLKNQGRDVIIDKGSDSKKESKSKSPSMSKSKTPKSSKSGNSGVSKSKNSPKKSESDQKTSKSSRRGK